MESYYAFEDARDAAGYNTCSIASDNYPLIVNCAGNFTSSFPFSTDNERGREDFYLLYIEKSSMDIFIGDKTVTAAAGSLVLFPPKYRYRYKFSSDEPLSYFWVHFTGSHAQKFLDECGFSRLPCVAFTGKPGKLISDFRSIFSIFENAGELRHLELACALERLLLGAAQNSGSEQRKRGFARSINYISSAYNTKISVPELAKMENLSNSRYVSLFKSYTGISPLEYILRLRMRSACDLLHTTDMTVKQIASLVGYEDEHYFSRIFKKHIGKTPSQYREG